MTINFQNILDKYSLEASDLAIDYNCDGQMTIADSFCQQVSIALQSVIPEYPLLRAEIEKYNQLSHTYVVYSNLFNKGSRKGKTMWDFTGYSNRQYLILKISDIESENTQTLAIEGRIISYDEKIQGIAFDNQEYSDYQKYYQHVLLKYGDDRRLESIDYQKVIGESQNYGRNPRYYDSEAQRAYLDTSGYTLWDYILAIWFTRYELDIPIEIPYPPNTYPIFETIDWRLETTSFCLERLNRAMQ